MTGKRSEGKEALEKQGRTETTQQHPDQMVRKTKDATRPRHREKMDGRASIIDESPRKNKEIGGLI